jgi:hypothetical protein
VQNVNEYTEKYVLVSRTELMRLFRNCHVPGCLCEVKIIKEIITGGSYKIRARCEAGHVYVWHSNPFSFDAKGDQFYDLNVALAAAVLPSGNNYTKISRLFKHLNVPFIDESTFIRLCDSYVYPTIDLWWTNMQECLLSNVEGHAISLCGDGHTDSPGFSAQYCTYSFVHNKFVLHLELVDKREANLKSTNMEKIGFLRGFLFLCDRVKIVKFCSDAHTQIKALFKHDERLASVEHQFDVFHKSVKLHSKLLEAANKRGNSSLHDWTSAIRNHFWFCAQQCNGDADKLVSLWISVLRHVTGQHVWQDGQCEHEIDLENDATVYLDGK